MHQLVVLHIATSNVRKYASLKRLVSATRVSVRIVRAPVTIPVPEENGSSPLVNARAKAQYYAMHLSPPLLVADDGLYMKDLERHMQIGPNIKSMHLGKPLTEAGLFRYWWDTLELTGDMTAIRRRVIVVISDNGKAYPISSETRVRLHKPDQMPLVISHNPLNHFMIPEGFSRCFDDLSIVELQRIDELLVRKLKDVLLKLF